VHNLTTSKRRRKAIQKSSIPRFFKIFFRALQKNSIASRKTRRILLTIPSGFYHVIPAGEQKNKPCTNKTLIPTTAIQVFFKIDEVQSKFSLPILKPENNYFSINFKINMHSNSFFLYKANYFDLLKINQNAYYINFHAILMHTYISYMKNT